MIFTIFEVLKFEKPIMFFLLIPFMILLTALLIISFVKFKPEEKKGVWIYRSLMFLSRALIILLLVIALASPYVTKKETSAGNPEINILYDNSSSMELFNLNIDQLKDTLHKEVPASVRFIGSGKTSMLGDEIFRQLHKKSLLLVTDGNNDKNSMDFKDVVTFANKFNTSIYAVKPSEEKKDISVTVIGPYSSIVDTEYVFDLELYNIKEMVKLRVKIDDRIEYEKETNEGVVQIKHKFKTIGEHKIIADILTEDYFDVNNHYYHVVDVVEKPNVLYLSDRTSYIDDILHARFNVNKLSAMPKELSKYYSIVVNDKMDDISYEEGKLIEEFTDDGNGLVVIGGERSFITNTNIDLLLPVKKGFIKETGVDFNFVFLVDGSGYVSEKLTKEELAVADIINYLSLRPEKINVAVGSFAHIGELISDWKPIQKKEETLKDMINHEDINTIEGVAWYRPAEFDRGLKLADKLFEGKHGNNNIVVVSDGAIREKTFKSALEYIKSMRSKGIRIHSFNLVNKEFDDTPLKQVRKSISSNGRGYFIERPQDAGNLLEKNLIISNTEHWITHGLSISGSLTNYNSVVATAAADVLVTTGTGVPIVSVNGYNKVGVIATDDGKEWAKDMYLQGNIFLVYRTMDWAVGDPNRKKDSYTRVMDAIVNKPVKVEYKGKILPTTDECKFYAVGDHYECTIVPKGIGFEEILGKFFGVNYDPEYKYIGWNEDAIKTLTLETDGGIFSPIDTKGIIEKVKNKAKVETTAKRYLDWYFIVGAMVIFLIEVLIRRLKEKIKKD